MGRALSVLIVAGIGVIVAGSALLVVLVFRGHGPAGAPRPASPQAADGLEPDETPVIDPAALEVDPALIEFRQTGEIRTGLVEVRALAIGPEGEIYVAGDKAIRRFSSDGKQQSQIATDAGVTCMAVGGREHVAPGRIYAGMEDRVQVFDPQGTRIAAWPSLGAKAALTSIAAAEHDVFAADAGNRIVWRFDNSGRVRGRIGEPNPARQVPGFLVTSRHFDLAAGYDELLYVVNPRALRIEGYTYTGDLEVHWGKSSPEIDGFFGCCNPAHLAIMLDGHFVTAEKGIPRIKLYTALGKFECVVAGPREMKSVAADLAVDRQRRVYALDPSTASVRIFERKNRAGAQDEAEWDFPAVATPRSQPSPKPESLGQPGGKHHDP